MTLQTKMSQDNATTEDTPKEVINIPERIVIKELAGKMNLPVTDIIAELMKNGIMSSMNESIDFETAGVIAEDLGFTTKKIEEEGEELGVKILEEALESDQKQLESRPPVVVVMGHVDHGKTKLLDAIRTTNIVDEEAGGITQSIGAYQIKEKGNLITLIDTPGHEAFSAMRSRGARVADIAILVIAADDGIQPQSREAYEIIKKAKLPFVVAINKIDKSEANIEKVKKELTELGIVPEEWGGKTIICEVSAKEKKGISELLEMILLVAELEKKSIMANPKREAVGTIIESHIDKGAGPQATVLIQTGTLKAADYIIVGGMHGKVKAMKDWRGRLANEARPSMPVRILGLKGAPKVGDILYVTKDRSEIKSLMKQHRLHSAQKQLKQQSTQKKQTKETDEDDGQEKKQEKKEFSIVLKTDTLGSQEAICESLEKLKNLEVKVEITAKGLGNITEKDIIQADSTDSCLIGFNVVLTAQAQKIQKDRQANIKIFTIIYELLDFVREELEKLLAPETIQTDLAKINILALFKTGKDHQIVGGKVTDGKVENKAPFRIMRNKEPVGKGEIVQLQSDKKNISEVMKDSECGLRVKADILIQEKDTLEVYREEQKARKLEI